LAWLLTATVGMPFTQAYLATTPGGINAVLAIADTTGTNASLVAAVQSLRLFAVCLLVPVLARKLNDTRDTRRVRDQTEEPNTASRAR
jgi:uncharacterized membrane protein AbrB (regulator of aidB expression)